MARYFEIGSSTPTVKLDSQGRGSVQYKVKNVSAAPTDGRAVLVSLPIMTPPAGAVQNKWVTLDPPIDHHFEKDEQTVYTVKIEVPQKDRAKAGTYTFRLDTVLVSIPDRGDEGPATAFTVEAVNEKKPSMLAWLIPLIVVVLVGIGVGTWLLLRPHGDKVPDVTGKSITDAAAVLAAAKLTVDPKMDTTKGTPAQADKVVSQTPAAGETAVQGAAVHLTLGASIATVPMLMGQTYESAQTLLTKNNLGVGTVTNAANPNFSGGVVFAQSIPEGTSVEANTAINLTVTPKTVAVPNVVSSTINSAVTLLKPLVLGGITCDQLDKPIISQSPIAGTPVPIGTAVNVTVPCSPNRYTGVVMYEQGSVAQKAIIANSYSMVNK